MNAAKSFFYNPATGHGLSGDPIKAIIAPRPIGWISSISGTGIPNLAPYSFFNMVCDTPPIVAFSSLMRKDTLANVEATGEFTCNLATRSLAATLNISSIPFPPDIDEFCAAGLDMAPGMAVRCPRVAHSPAALECRLIEIRRIYDMTGHETEAWLVLGQVVGVHIATDCIRDGRFDTAGAGIIQRGGYGGDYFETRPAARFQMKRPKPG